MLSLYKNSFKNMLLDLKKEVDANKQLELINSIRCCLNNSAFDKARMTSFVLTEAEGLVLNFNLVQLITASDHDWWDYQIKRNGGVFNGR